MGGGRKRPTIRLSERCQRVARWRRVGDGDVRFGEGSGRRALECLHRVKSPSTDDTADYMMRGVNAIRFTHVESPVLALADQWACRSLSSRRGAWTTGLDVFAPLVGPKHVAT
jgi:hypothetical protein